MLVCKENLSVIVPLIINVKQLVVVKSHSLFVLVSTEAVSPSPLQFALIEID